MDVGRIVRGGVALALGRAPILLQSVAQRLDPIYGVPDERDLVGAMRCNLKSPF